MKEEAIAIIGIGCRFPGGVNDPESFWKLLVEGRNAVTDVPADSCNIDRFYELGPLVAGNSNALLGGLVTWIDDFDPQFFDTLLG